MFENHLNLNSVPSCKKNNRWFGVRYLIGVLVLSFGLDSVAPVEAGSVRSSLFNSAASGCITILATIFTGAVLGEKQALVVGGAGLLVSGGFLLNSAYRAVKLRKQKKLKSSQMPTHLSDAKRWGRRPDHRAIDSSDDLSDIVLSPWYWWHPANIWNDDFEDFSKDVHAHYEATGGSRHIDIGAQKGEIEEILRANHILGAGETLVLRPDGSSGFYFTDEDSKHPTNSSHSASSWFHGSDHHSSAHSHHGSHDDSTDTSGGGDSGGDSGGGGDGGGGD